MKEKIKIAFIKFAGLAAGGTEKYLQTLAANLPKEEFEVDYYYTDGVQLIGNSWKHPDTDRDRVKYMIDNGINIIHVNCEARDDRFGPPYTWINSNFFELFNQKKYDIVQTGRSGYQEYPFCDMKNDIFIDSIHGYGVQGIEKRDNIIKTILLSSTQIKNWINNGGDEDKIVCIPPLIEFSKLPSISLRKELNIENDIFIYGMHQGNREDIFSDIPLQAYKQIENEKTLFLMLGGANKYRVQAQQLNIKNIKFLNFNGDSKYINDFVKTLDVFSHGRFDGEVCSAAIIEALYHGKPIISHPAINNGHFEQIEGCGFVAFSVDEYSKKMQFFLDNKQMYDTLSNNCLLKYNNLYSFQKSIDKYTNLYKEIVYERKI